MSAQQIIFFQKSKCDISNPNVTVSASQGNDYAALALNRSDASAWITTGSVDADSPTWIVDMSDAESITNILLAHHNFKSYTVKYWDGAAYQDFSTPISETTNTATTTRHSFTAVSTSRIKLTVNGTMTANEDKYLYQFIATNLIGQFSGWPIISNVIHGTNIKRSTMLSGKQHLNRNVGGFSCTLTVKRWTSDADLLIVEDLYDSVEGFLMWLSGGSETQFNTTRKGYRLQDLFLMKCMDDYSPNFVDGIYQNGLAIQMNLAEVVP